MEAAEITAKVMAAMLLITLVLTSLPTGVNFRYYMWYLRSLQLVVHLPMFSVVLPPNAHRYIEGVKPIVVFDMLPMEQINDFFFTFDMAAQRILGDPILDQMKDINYGTYNSFIILGSVWVYMAVYLIYLSTYLINMPYFSNIKINRQNDEVRLLEGGMDSGGS